MIDSFPSTLAIVSEVRRYNKKAARGKATAAVSSGVITIYCTRYDDEEDVNVEDVRLNVTKSQLNDAINDLQAMVADLQTFKALVKDL